MRRITSVLALLGACGLLAACGNPMDVTLYEAGVYKGQKDDLLAKLEKQETQNELEQRFSKVQTDR